MRPVDFFDSFAVPFPESTGPMNENGYLRPPFTAASVIAATFSREEFPSLAGDHPLRDMYLWPKLFVQLALVKIEVEVAAGPQCARDRAERSRKISSVRQMINDSPLRCNEVNLHRQTKRSHVGSTNPHVETFRASLFTRDPAHLARQIPRENSQATTREFDRCYASAAPEFAYLARLREERFQQSVAGRIPRSGRLAPQIIVELADFLVRC
jgi:hypothetical protein